jgi:hypothetical protein
MFEMKLFEVRFQLSTGALFKSVIPAYSNGGAEHKVLDLLCDRCKRALAFDSENEPVAESLYPGAQPIDCTLIATL